MNMMSGQEGPPVVSLLPIWTNFGVQAHQVDAWSSLDPVSCELVKFRDLYRKVLPCSLKFMDNRTPQSEGVHFAPCAGSFCFLQAVHVQKDPCVTFLLLGEWPAA